MSITLKNVDEEEAPYIYKRYEVMATRQGVKCQVLPEPFITRDDVSMVCPSAKVQLGDRNHKFLCELITHAECLTCLIRKNGGIELLFASDETARKRAQAIAEFLAIKRFAISIWQPVEYGLVGYNTSQALFSSDEPAPLRDVKADVATILAS
jgi:hypothetical protein